jgi:PAS domain S-box-containing protein
MPGMDGFEVARRVRHDNAHQMLPIIMVTGLWEIEYRVKGIEAGCNDFISKPLYKEELLARVKSLLQIKAYNELKSNYQKEMEAEVIWRTDELKHTIEKLQQEITDSKKTDVLQSSSVYLRNLIETSLDALVTISREGKITDVNRATEKITGISREKLIGSDFSDYFTDPEMARAGYQKAFKQGKIIDYQLTIRNTTGTITEVLYNASVYRNEQGESLGVFAAARDITALKAIANGLENTGKELEVAKISEDIAH